MNQFARYVAIAASLLVVPVAASAATVATGSNHTVIRASDGTVWTWGANATGQLGMGDTTQRKVPTKITTLSGITQVAAGANHTAALKSDGTIWTWGQNNFGQIGDGTTQTRKTPVKILTLTGMTAIACGDFYCLAVKSNGTIWGWGYNGKGQIGDGTSTTPRKTPVQATVIVSVANVAAGSSHSLAVKTDGTVWAWGLNDRGQLGNGVTSSTPTLTPTQVPALTSFNAVSAAERTSRALKTDGTVWAWGENANGQLGDGTTNVGVSPIQLGGISSVGALGAGWLHTLATRSDDTSVWAWGQGTSGQLGDGAATQRTLPVQVPDLSTITAVTAGHGYHSIAVTSDGVVWGWGLNTSGQVGDGTTVQRNSPVALSDVNYNWLVATPTMSIAAGTYNVNQTVALATATAGATIHYTTNGATPTTSDPSGTSALVNKTMTLKARAVLAGRPSSNVGSVAYVLMPLAPTFNPVQGTYTTARTVAITTTTTGAFVRYTTNGTDPTEASATPPAFVNTTTTVKARAFKTDWTPSAIMSATYTMNFGTLAAPVASPASASSPTPVWVTLTATNGASIRYTTDGVTTPTTASPLYTGQLLISDTTTLKSKAFHPDYVASAVTTGTYAILLATIPTFVPDAGAYAAGQVITLTTTTPGATIRYTLNGVNPTASDPGIPSGGNVVAGNYTLKAAAFKTGYTTSPVKVAVYTTTSSLHTGRVAAGRTHTAVVKADGTVWTWGANTAGTLGTGGWSNRGIPGSIALTGVTAGASGYDFSLMRRTDGTVWAWGSNASGQLGDGTQGVDRPTPYQVPLTGTYVAVAVGQSHSLAVRSDGTVWAWGANGKGQLGDGTVMTPRLSPVQVLDSQGAPFDDVIAVSAGWQHSHALKADGTVWGWGYSDVGQVGDGTTIERHTPVQVDGLTSVTAIASSTSANHTVALRNDGTVWVWGSNQFGQGGDGGTLDHWTPARAMSLPAPATAIAAGDSHTLALAADGHVWAWGHGGFGQIGNGATSHSFVAFQIASPADVVSIGGSGSHSHAISSDGSVWGWGAGNGGAIGDGVWTKHALTPVRVSEANFDWKVGTPTMGLGTWWYWSPTTTSVTVEDTGATIRYTTNGAEPTVTDTEYVGAVDVDRTMALKVKAWKAGMPAGNTGSEVYTFLTTAPSATPGGGNYPAAQSVTLTTPTTGATIRYTTDGSDPMAASPQYTVPVPITQTTILKARTFRDNWTTSEALITTYTLNLGTLAAPVFTPPAGNYTDTVTVSLSASAGASIRYTTNGTDPDTSSPLYSTPIVVNQATTFKARAYHPSYATSAVASATYTIKLTTPTISPGGGSYPVGQNVTISTAVAGATIRYTVNGADPTATSFTIGSGVPLSLVATSTIKARVYKPGCDPSDVASADYTITGGAWNGVLAGGDTHSALGDSTGQLWAWGKNTEGELGDGTTVDKRVPTLIPGSGTTTDVATGQYHTLRIRNDGVLLAWGYNGYGQLGDGTVTQRLSPVVVTTLSNVSSAAAGDLHSVAVAGGVLYAWGRNDYGQLGDGTTTQRNTPTAVSTLNFPPGIVFTAVAAGTYHGVALASDGTVWAWGQNTVGQLGIGTWVSPSAVPVQVVGLDDPSNVVVAIAAGSFHNLALKADGTIAAWGKNDDGGALGNGMTTNSNLPVNVLNITGARVIAAGWTFSLAVTADGSAWSWGSNSLGQLGDGTTLPKSTPGRVGSLVGITTVGAGNYHALALDLDGAIWAWGNNGTGQLGDGTTEKQLSPIRISDGGGALRTATPTFSINGGSFNTVQNVTVSSITPGADIHFTTNGVDPTPADPVPTNGIVQIVQSSTLKAIAVAPGLSPSNVAAAAFTLTVPLPTSAPAGGTYSTPQTVTFASTLSGAVIRYTTNTTVPTETSPLYTDPIVVASTTNFWFRAFRSGWTPSSMNTTYYEFKVATPLLSPGGGSYSGPQTVTVSTVTPGAVLHYTMDGHDPTESSPVVASGGTVIVGQSLTLKVKGWMSGAWLVSSTETASYEITFGSLAAPTITPPGGTYPAAQTVAIAGGAPDVVIRYTLDGSEPSLWSPLYAAPLRVDWTTTVKARAFKAGWAASTSATAAYTIAPSGVVSPPTFSIPGGSYTTKQMVVLTSATPLATVRYTADGTDPIAGSPAYLNPIPVDRHMRLKASAFKSGMTTSPVRKADYQITGAASSGTNFVLALKTDGTVWGWGANDYGQLGTGNNTPSNIPIQVAGLTGAVAVSAGKHPWYLSGGAVKGDGTVWMWGSNASGQLGDGTITTRLLPVQATVAPGVPVANVTALSVGGSHTLALKSDGTVLAWGYNQWGQLGDGTTITPRLRAVPVAAPGFTDVVAISASENHSMALTRDGRVWAWGINQEGELGNGGTTQSNTPVLVSSLSGVSSIAAGGNRSFAVKTDGALTGSVWAWGYNTSFGYLGDGSALDRTLPVRVLERGIAPSTGGGATLFLRLEPNGRRAIWGTAGHRADVLNASSESGSTVPVPVIDGDFVSISVNTKMVAVRGDTSLLVWGDNRNGDGFVLGVSGGGNTDPDQDGLTNAEEAAIGSDPWNPDTNGDGISDGVAVRSGISATNPDMDGDGRANAAELAIGADPFIADTDGDGVLDGADAFPLDPLRWQAPPPVPGDTTPPLINLTEPTNAVLISSVP